ncbi:MAG: hypothetical protein KDK08_12335 [Rhizobiaceae bacterium]|nr:hypothetical protein [Rhizobiaceae bacterium]
MKSIAAALAVMATLAHQAGAVENKGSEKTGRITSPTELFSDPARTHAIATIPAGAMVVIIKPGKNWLQVRVRMGARTLTGYVAPPKVATFDVRP